MTALDSLLCVRCHRIVEGEERNGLCSNAHDGAHAFEKKTLSQEMLLELPQEDLEPTSAPVVSGIRARPIVFITTGGTKIALDEQQSHLARMNAFYEGKSVEKYVHEVYLKTLKVN